MLIYIGVFTHFHPVTCTPYQVSNERLISFEFPERPGALGRFLNHMQSDWNITLFHYRNHGADYGRILVGLQVPPHEKREFKQFLKTIAYRHWDETENPVYKLFLR